MIRLVYASTLGAGVERDEIERIVAKSAERNAAVQVTGILAIEDRNVCQLLEGEEAAVERLYATIRADPRHGGVVELDRRPIVRRSFGEWAMTRRPMFDIVAVAFAKPVEEES